MTQALNQKRAENDAPLNRRPSTRLRDTPIRDATESPTPTRATRNAYVMMEKPPQWLECDRFIYCRVNVAKALIARARVKFAAQSRKHRYSEVSRVPSEPQLHAKFSRFINHDHAYATKFRSGTSKLHYPSTVAPLPSAACAAASRAIGTRNGEHDT